MNLLTSLKSLIIRGLFILLPILILTLLIAEIFSLLIALATPLADLLFPPGELDEVQGEVFLAILLLVGFSLLTGLIANSIIGKKWGEQIEQRTLGRLAMYRAVKRLTSGFIDSDSKRAFQPGLLHAADDEADLIYIIENHGNGKLTVLLPWAPAAFAGSLKIVSEDKVTVIDSNIGEYSKVISHWGVGLPKVLNRD